MSALASLDELRRQIEAGHVVALVGTGVTAGATKGAEAATWTGLIKHGIEHCVKAEPTLCGHWQTTATHLADSPDVEDLVSVAQKITNELGGCEDARFYEWLSQTIGKLTALDDTVIQAIGALKVPVVTTNYDDLLSASLKRKPITWADHHQLSLQEFVRNGHKSLDSILHLHGHWSDPQSVVFGNDSYSRLTQNAHAMEHLKTLFTQRTLLFIGCGDGLNDPDFGRLMKWAREVFKPKKYPHYRLVKGDVSKLLESSSDGNLIIPLSYGDKHENLAPFLEKLNPHPKPEPVASSASTTPLEFEYAHPEPSCFGRKVEVDQLVKNLTAKKPVATILLGGPGIGKSTITLKALYDKKVAEKFGSRRYFIRCDGATSSELLIHQVATALGIKAPQPEPPLFRELAREPTVLALDNAETPLQGDGSRTEAFLQRLAAIPGVALVASVRGDEAPYGATYAPPIQVPRLKEDPAREAFLNVTKGKFADDPKLNELLTAVDHVPLAIWLLAHAALNDPNLSITMKRWDQQHTKLLRRHDATDRYSNIETSYELSINSSRMTPEGKRLFAILGFLPDGIAYDNMDVMLPKQGYNAANVLCKLGLAYEEQGRLRTFAPLSQYAADYWKPAEADEAAVLEYYCHLATALGNGARRQGGEAAARRHVPETANLAVALLKGLEGDEPSRFIIATCRLTRSHRFRGRGTVLALQRARQRSEEIANPELLADCINSLGDIGLLQSD